MTVNADLGGVNQTKLVVNGGATTCYDILLAFGITATQFRAQNPVSVIGGEGGEKEGGRVRVSD